MDVASASDAELEGGGGGGPLGTTVALLDRLRSVVPDRLVAPHAAYVLVEPTSLVPSLPPWFFGRVAHACLSAGGTRGAGRGA